MDGLRERKKQETRDALSWAALRLAVKRGGLDHVLVEEIAAEAGVSARTFNNYFSSKAEAVVSRHLDRVRNMALALRSRPTVEPLWEAIIQAAVDVFDDSERTPDPQWTAGVRLMMTDPALVGEIMKTAAVSERDLAGAVAERTGTDAGRDLYPQLVAAAVGAATQVTTQRWLVADPPVSFTVALREALRQIAAGLPAPTH